VGGGEADDPCPGYGKEDILDEHYCQPILPSYRIEEYPWHRCNDSCYDSQNEPMEFDQENPGDCGTKPMECQFPFFYKGTKYDSCTNDLLLEYPYGDFIDVNYDDFDGRTEETFYWCATQVLSDQTMQEGKWGICNPETCAPNQWLVTDE